MIQPHTIFDELDELCHDEDFEHVDAAAPTDALCGSWAKVEAMRQRVERGECLYHPDDCTDAIEPVEPRCYVPGLRELSVDSRFAMAED